MLKVEVPNNAREDDARQKPRKQGARGRTICRPSPSSKLEKNLGESKKKAKAERDEIDDETRLQRGLRSSRAKRRAERQHARKITSEAGRRAEDHRRSRKKARTESDARNRFRSLQDGGKYTA